MKTAAMIIITAVLFALCLPVFAAQFPDVPTDHWAYAAVQDLSDKGVIIGYPDGTFSGKRALTRYEFAQALSRAIPVIAKLAAGAGIPGPAGPQGEVGPAGPQGPVGVTPEQLANIQKLLDEFKDELAAQGVDIQALKKDVAALDARLKIVETEQQRVKITAETMFGFEGAINNGGDATDLDNRGLGFSENPLVDNAFFNDFQLGIKGRVGPVTTVTAIIDAGDYLPFALETGSFDPHTSSFFGPNDEQFQLFQLYMHSAISLGPLGNAQATVGRFPFQLTPLTLKFPAPDSYLYVSTLQNGDYVLDGGNASFKLGMVDVTAFAADRVASLGLDQPALQVNGGILVDQLAGARGIVAMPWKGNLGLTYYQAGPDTGMGQLRVFGADTKFYIGTVQVAAEWAETDPSGYMNDSTAANDGCGLNKNNQAWNAGVSYKIGKLAISNKYTQVDANYIAPGSWSRLGKAVNLQNVEGPVSSISYALTPAVSLEAGGSFLQPKNDDFVIARSSTNQGVTFGAGDMDKITGWKAGVKYALTAANGVDLGIEQVQWKSNDDGTAKETYYNIGFGHTFNPNASLKVLYQIVDYKLGGGGFDFYGDGPYRGGITTAEFHLKY